MSEEEYPGHSHGIVPYCRFNDYVESLKSRYDDWCKEMRGLNKIGVLNESLRKDIKSLKFLLSCVEKRKLIEEHLKFLNILEKDIENQNKQLFYIK